jgi:hypothetical protein
MQRPDLAPEPLQREGDGGIADVPVDQMALDRENGAHARKGADSRAAVKG